EGVDDPLDVVGDDPGAVGRDLDDRLGIRDAFGGDQNLHGLLLWGLVARRNPVSLHSAAIPSQSRAKRADTRRFGPADAAPPSDWARRAPAAASAEIRRAEHPRRHSEPANAGEEGFVGIGVRLSPAASYAITSTVQWSASVTPTTIAIRRGGSHA